MKRLYDLMVLKDLTTEQEEERAIIITGFLNDTVHADTGATSTTLRCSQSSGSHQILLRNRHSVKADQRPI